MKVIQINTVCGFGSTGRIVVNIADYISLMGDYCEIAYGRSTNSYQNNNTYFIGTDIDHNIHGLISRINDRQGFYSKKATIQLINHIKELDPDIIHLHNIHGYYLNIEELFKFFIWFNKPVVWTLHDCWSFTGHCTYFDIAGCNKWLTQCEKCEQKKCYPKSYFIDNSKKNYQQKKELFNSYKNIHFVTPSNWLNNLLKKSFLSNFDCRTIYNGIDLDKFHYSESDIRSKYNIKNKIILLGVASLWGKRKGYTDFLSLSNKISNDYQIIMIGLNDKQLRELPSNIIGIKRTENLEELCQFYSVADYYLNLTYEDNFPTTNIEALACGTPVITYNTGGSIEAIDKKSGVIVNKSDIDGVIEAIKNNSFNREDCINRSLLFRANDRYSEYYDLYCSLLNT